MIALLIVAFFLLAGLFALCARRALAVAVAASLTWIAHIMGGDWIMSLSVFLAVLAFSAYVLDLLNAQPALRLFMTGAECFAGIAFGVVAAYAVFGSSGVSGGALISAMLVGGALAMISVLRFRLPRWSLAV